jgi:hypothetical protein
VRGYKNVYWFGQERPYVQRIRLLLVLPCTGVLVVGVTSFREREQIPGLFEEGVCASPLSKVGSLWGLICCDPIGFVWLF